LAHLNAMPLWQPWSIAKMANYARLSESRFHFVFKKVTGTVPSLLRSGHIVLFDEHGLTGFPASERYKDAF